MRYVPWVAIVLVGVLSLVGFSDPCLRNPATWRSLLCVAKCEVGEEGGTITIKVTPDDKKRPSGKPQPPKPKPYGKGEIGKDQVTVGGGVVYREVPHG